MRIAVLSDLHVAPHRAPEAYWHNRLHFETALDRLRRAIALTNEMDADALLVAGDLAHEGDEKSLDRLLQPLSKAGRPPTPQMARASG